MIRIEYLMLMIFMALVDTCLSLEVVRYHRGLANRPFLMRSTMEAELTALDTATVEAEWLRELLMDLPVVEKPVPAILMNCDNQTVIVKVNSAKDNAKSSRHVKRRLKSVRKLRNSGVISVTYIQTDKNLANPFTKGLSRNVIDSASREMGMRPV